METGSGWIGAGLFIVGVTLIVWGAERFTDATIATARLFALSPFFVGAIVSGFEPENLVTGIAAVTGGLPQVALGTVIGATVVMLTAGLGVTLLAVPLATHIPKLGIVGLVLITVIFAVVLWNDGVVSRVEACLLGLVAIILLASLYRRSPVSRGHEVDGAEPPLRSRPRALTALAVGLGALLVGAELTVQGAAKVIASFKLSEAVFGMTVVAVAESIEEAGRMLVPARRGHPELAWGNVIGTVIMLVGVNLGAIALVRPIVADALVLRLHAPFMIACVLLVAVALLSVQRLGRAMGAFLLLLFVLYLVLNAQHVWASDSPRASLQVSAGSPVARQNPSRPVPRQSQLPIDPGGLSETIS